MLAYKAPVCQKTSEAPNVNFYEAVFLHRLHYFPLSLSRFPRVNFFPLSLSRFPRVNFFSLCSGYYCDHQSLCCCM